MTSPTSQPTSDSAAPVWDELRVPDEPGVWFCARHRTVKTRLRCGRCEKPICPKCTVMAPTGARCRDCASNRGGHLYQITPKIGAISFVTAFVGGIVGAFIAFFASGLGMLGLLALFYASAIGPVLGRVITRASSGKRGPKIAAVTITGLLLGLLATAAITFQLGNPILWLVAVVGAVATWNFLR